MNIVQMKNAVKSQVDEYTDRIKGTQDVQTLNHNLQRILGVLQLALQCEIINNNECTKYTQSVIGEYTIMIVKLIK